MSSSAKKMSVNSYVVYSKLKAVCVEMGENLTRLSRSPLIAEERSFASALLDRKQRLVTQSQGEPSHTYAVRESVRQMMDYFAFDIAEGDVFVTSDPYYGGTAGNILTISLPVFYSNENIFTPTVRIPISDLGGELPGSLQPEAADIWQETLRVTPIRLYRGGVLQKDLFNFLLLNSRAPEMLAGDLKAAVAVCRKAGKEINELLSRYGVQSVEQALAAMYDYSHTLVTAPWAEHTDCSGDAEVSFALDDQDSGKICTKVTYAKNKVTIDFTGTSETAEQGLNLTRQSASAAAMLAVVASEHDDLDLNEGVLNSIEFNFPENSLVNPKFPAAVNLGQTITSHIVAACVNQAVTAALKANEDSPLPVYGTGPAAVLYAPVGTVEENPPLYLEPGFSISAAGWGPAVMRGGRRLASAEELEIAHELRVAKRELSDSGDMHVIVKNIAATRELSLAAPGVIADGQQASIIQLRGDDMSGCTKVDVFNQDDALEFIFPVVRG